MESRERAVALRKKGMTYKEISSTLDGAVSVDWCKRNLKGVPIPEPTLDECTQELITLASRPEGCSSYEAAGVVFKYHKNATMEKVRTMKKKAKKLNTECLFRPDWLDTNQPTLSHNAINAYALHLMDEIDNLVRHYTDTFPSTSSNAVRYELLKLSCSRLISKEPLALHISKNEKIAEELEKRVRTSLPT